MFPMTGLKYLGLGIVEDEVERSMMTNSISAISANGQYYPLFRVHVSHVINPLYIQSIII